MRYVAPALVAIAALSCTRSEPVHEAVRPFAKVNVGHALNRTVKRTAGAVLGDRAGHARSFGDGREGGLWHFEFRADVTLAPDRTEDFLRELCRQIGLAVEQYATTSDAGFPSMPEGAGFNGYRDGRCDYYAERDGILGWLNVPEPVRDGETLRLRVVTVQS